MCGIVAVVESGKDPCDVALLESLTDALHHRGPDGRGVWLESGVGLGHARLSIIDTSQAGRQPMVSRCGRWVLTFNGEIYNHAELRKELASAWVGHSDTETLVEAISAWGPDDALRRIQGMFAFAVWDTQQRQLFVARDRMGEKPLYYGVVGGQFRVASELKALLADGSRPQVDRYSLGLFFRHGYVPSPHCIWTGIRKLGPGEAFRVAPGELDQLPIPWAWWSVEEQAQQAPTGARDEEVVDSLEELLVDAVSRQMVADVPLGAFLSGGIDSSLIVALMQKSASRPVKTFTIGFEEEGFNESGYAEQVAQHLGTEHHTMMVTAQDAMATIPRLSSVWDEPFSDSSQIPTLLLSQLTREHVTVSLSGDGGDELFAGYSRYGRFLKLEQARRRVPARVRRLVSDLAVGVRAEQWDRVLNGVSVFGLGTSGVSGDRIHKLADVIRSETGDELYRLLVSQWSHPESVLLGGGEHPSRLTTSEGVGPKDGPERLQYLDQLSYLPDDILVKVDRAAMAVSLETRVPFLDPRVVEYSWRVPSHLKYRPGAEKWVLREILSRHVPTHLFERPKMGFGIPLGEWLRGPLKAWASELLSPEQIRAQGFLDANVVQKLWREHQEGSRNWQARLWVVLMFQSWYQTWGSPE